MSRPSALTTTIPLRRWLRFSLRTLIVLMLVLGAGLGWFAREVQKARAQRKAAKAIEKLGGSVDWGLPSGGMIRTAVAGVGKLFREDLSGDATMVVLVGSQDTDAGLAHLWGLRQLRQLYVTGSQVCGAGLTHLRGLTQLRWLGLSGIQVTDAGLVHLRGLTQLEWLDLSGTQVTDAGLVHLRGLTQLRKLDLTGTQVSDAGLAHLQGLAQLEVLILSDTAVSDASINELKKALPNVYISGGKPITEKEN